MSGHGPGDFIFGADPIRGGSGAEAAIDTHVYSLSWRWKNIDFCKGFSLKKSNLDIDFILDLDWISIFIWIGCSSEPKSAIMFNFSDLRSPKVL